MKFDFAGFRDVWSRRILPNMGLVFASFLLLMFALSGLGPLLRHFSPDEKKIDKEATAEAQTFVQTVIVPTGVGPSLDTPHRVNAQVGQWLELKISEMMNLAPASYDDHVRGMSGYADERGRSDFHGFMTSSGILDTLTANAYQLRGSTEGDALLLNKGVVDGRYRWLFEVPMLLTFLPADAKSYKDTQNLSQHVIVTAQAGRVAYGTSADELMLESFTVRKNPAYPDQQ